MAFRAVEFVGTPEEIARQEEEKRIREAQAAKDQAARDIRVKNEQVAYGENLSRPEYKFTADLYNKSLGFGEREKAYDEAFLRSLAAQNQIGTQQQQQLQQLQGLVSGPSIAEQQMKMAQDRNLAQQVAAASSARGGQNLGLLNRQVAQAGAEGGQAIAAQAGVAKMQEDLAKQKLLADTLAQARQSEALTGGQEADLVGKYIAAGLGADQAKIAAQVQNRQIDAQQGAVEQQVAAQRAASENSLLGALLPGIGTGAAKGLGEGLGLGSLFGGGSSAAGAAGGAAAAEGGGGFLAWLGSLFSDERVKEKVKDGNDDVQSFLDAMKAHTYEYKDKSMGEGKHTSVMAQELEETEAGKKMVMETPRGKMVNYMQGLPTLFASMAQMNERIKKMEGRKNG